MSTFEQKLFSALRPRKRRKGQRRGPWRSKKYRQWIAGHVCVICGGRDTQAAHTQNNGTSSKGPDWSCVPLCIRHHAEYDAGRERFELVHGGIRMRDCAAEFYRDWNGGPPEPECTCEVSGDRADARNCEYHKSLNVPRVIQVQEVDGGRPF